MADRMEYREGVLVASVADNGNGTGTRHTYDAEGNVTSTEELADLPIPQPETPSLDEQVAELQATVTEQAATVAALLAIIEGT